MEGVPAALLESACGEEPAWLAEAQEELAVSSIAVAVEDELPTTALESTEEPDWLAAAQEELVVGLESSDLDSEKKQQQHDVEKQLKERLEALADRRRGWETASAKELSEATKDLAERDVALVADGCGG